MNQTSIKCEICFVIVAWFQRPVISRYGPNEIVHFEFLKTIMDLLIVLVSEIPDEPLDLFVADPLGV